MKITKALLFTIFLASLNATDYMLDPCVKSCNENRRASYGNAIQVMQCINSCDPNYEEPKEKEEADLSGNPLQTIQIGPVVNPCSALTSGGYSNAGGGGYNDNSSSNSSGGGSSDFPLSYQDNGEFIKGEEQVTWDECNKENGGKITTKFVNSEGCNEVTVSKEYIQFFEKNFSACVQEAAGGGAEKIFFEHVGIAGDSNHTNTSNHSVNRAIDIKNISVTVNGQQTTYSSSEQSQHPEKSFFNKMRDCWSNKIQEYKSNCPGSAPKGSIGHEDHDHEHHIHLSLPYCPSNGYKSK